MSQAEAKLKVGVIGPAGFGGSYLCVELLHRGHEVVGISRNPEKLGAHDRYTPRKADVSAQSIEELAEAFKGLDVLVNEYGPHSAGHEALQYSTSRFQYYLTENIKLIKNSAVPGSNTKDSARRQTLQSPLLHHGRRLRQFIHASKRLPVRAREQGLVASVPSWYRR